MRSKEEILPCEGGEALAQVAQRSCGCTLCGSIEGQVGWCFEHPGLVAGQLELGDLKGPFQPKPFYDSMKTMKNLSWFGVRLPK